MREICFLLFDDEIVLRLKIGTRVYAHAYRQGRL